MGSLRVCTVAVCLAMLLLSPAGCKQKHSSTPSSGDYNVVFDGDSLTLGWPEKGTAAYPYQCVAVSGSNWNGTNLGIGGQRIDQFAAHTATYYGVARDNIIVVWGGANDIAQGYTASDVLSRLKDYVAHRKKEAPWRVIVCSITPAATVDSTVRIAANELIRNNWSSFADGFVDLARDPRLSDEANLAYFHTDNVHFTAAGYRVVAELVAAGIKSYATGSPKNKQAILPQEVCKSPDSVQPQTPHPGSGRQESLSNAKGMP